MTAVERRHIKTRQGLHHAAELIGCVGRHQQLKFMVEQHVGMHRYRMLNAATLEHLQENLPVGCICKRHAARHSPMKHVVGLASNNKTVQASHVVSQRPAPERRQAHTLNDA